jgi:hypothetical protein
MHEKDATEKRCSLCYQATDSQETVIHSGSLKFLEFSATDNIDFVEVSNEN